MTPTITNAAMLALAKKRGQAIIAELERPDALQAKSKPNRRRNRFDYCDWFFTALATVCVLLTLALFAYTVHCLIAGRSDATRNGNIHGCSLAVN